MSCWKDPRALASAGGATHLRLLCSGTAGRYAICRRPLLQEKSPRCHDLSPSEMRAKPLWQLAFRPAATTVMGQSRYNPSADKPPFCASMSCLGPDVRLWLSSGATHSLPVCLHRRSPVSVHPAQDHCITPAHKPTCVARRSAITLPTP